MAEKKSSSLVLASSTLAERLGVEKPQMLESIKAQCFRGVQPDKVSNAQLAAFVAVANEVKVNPLIPGMLYAYPDRGGIMPIIGPDGIFTLLASHPDIEGWECHTEKLEDGEMVGRAVIRHKKLGEIKKECYLSEWKVSSNPNWNSRPRHMLEIRTLKHCARQVLHGIPMDEDERVIAGATNVTHTADRPEVPQKEKGFTAMTSGTGQGPDTPMTETVSEAEAETVTVTVEAELVEDEPKKTKARKPKAKAPEVVVEPEPEPAEPEPEPAEPEPEPEPEPATEPEPEPAVELPEEEEEWPKTFKAELVEALDQQASRTDIGYKKVKSGGKEYGVIKKLTIASEEWSGSAFYTGKDISLLKEGATLNFTIQPNPKRPDFIMALKVTEIF